MPRLGRKYSPGFDGFIYHIASDMVKTHNGESNTVHGPRLTARLKDICIGSGW